MSTIMEALSPQLDPSKATPEQIAAMQARGQALAYGAPNQDAMRGGRAGLIGHLLNVLGGHMQLNTANHMASNQLGTWLQGGRNTVQPNIPLGPMQQQNPANWQTMTQPGQQPLGFGLQPLGPAQRAPLLPLPPVSTQGQ